MLEARIVVTFGKMGKNWWGKKTSCLNQLHINYKKNQLKKEALLCCLQGLHGYISFPLLFPFMLRNQKNIHKNYLLVVHGWRFYIWCFVPLGHSFINGLRSKSEWIFIQITNWLPQLCLLNKLFLSGQICYASLSSMVYDWATCQSSRNHI